MLTFIIQFKYQLTGTLNSYILKINYNKFQMIKYTFPVVRKSFLCLRLRKATDKDDRSGAGSGSGAVLWLSAVTVSGVPTSVGFGRFRSVFLIKTVVSVSVRFFDSSNLSTHFRSVDSVTYWLISIY